MVKINFSDFPEPVYTLDQTQKNRTHQSVIEVRSCKLRNQKWVYWFFFIFLVLICARFVSFDKYMATSQGGDSPAHMWTNHQYCQKSFAWDRSPTNDIFYPVGVSIAPTYDTPFLTAISCPVHWTLGAVAGFNFYIFMQLFLLFMISTWFIRKHVKNPWLQISFVWLYCFCGFAQWRMLGQPNLLSCLWSIPLLLGLYQNLDLKNRSSTLGFFLAIAICLSSAWQNISFLFPLLIIGAIRIYKKQGLNPQTLTNSGLGIVLMSVFCWIFCGPMFLAISSGEYVSPVGAKSSFNADILSYIYPPFFTWTYKILSEILPTTWEPLESGFTERLFNIDFVSLIFLGPAIFWSLKETKEKKNRWLLALGLIYFILSLGSFLQIANRNLLNLSYYDGLSRIPPFSLTRNPGRYAIFLSFLAPFLMVKYLDRRWTKAFNTKFFAAVFSCLCLIATGVTSLSYRFPVLEFSAGPMGQVIQEMKKDPDPDAKFVLFPMLFPVQQISSIYQVLTGKKQITGYASYTLLTDKLMKALDVEYGDLSLVGCFRRSEDYKRLEDSLTAIDIYIDFFKRKKIKYLFFGTGYLGEVECKAYNKWVEEIKKAKGLELVAQTLEHDVYRINY